MEEDLEDEDDDEEAGANRKLDDALRHCSTLAAYSLKRLARGLASSRQGARQGFSLALRLALEALAPLGCIAPQGVLLLLATQLQTKGAKGAELKDVLLGRAFGYSCLVRAGMATGGEPATEVCQLLLDLWEKKAPMREATCAILLDLTDQLDRAGLAALWQTCPALGELLAAEGEALGPEGLWLALRLQPKLPADAEVSCLPRGAAGMGREELARHLFEPGFFRKRLAPALLQSAVSSPRLHSVWPQLLAVLVPGFEVDRGSRAGHASGGRGIDPAQLGTLWLDLVDAQMFGSSSHEKKHLGFQLFQILLPFLTPDTAHVVSS